MPNGATVALPLELDPPIGREHAEIIERIGATVADAAIAVCAGISDWEADGRLSGTTRVRTGDLFVQLYELQETTLGKLDFNTTARREGKRTIMRRHGAALKQHYGAALSAERLGAVLDEIIGWPLDVLAKLTAVERALAH